MSVDTKWPDQDYQSMVRYYGEVGTRQSVLTLPYPMKLAWAPTQIIKKIQCHEKVKDSLRTILEATVELYGIEQIKKLKLDVYGGCLNVRKKRGGSSWSIHSWGAAFDVDPDRNQLRWDHTRASLPRDEYADFWEIVEREGWTSLGRAKDYDWMHFQAADL